jgi:hypothetical protein
VIVVFGELKPALMTADAARLFDVHFGTTASVVRVSHGPCEFLLFFTDAEKAKEAQAYRGHKGFQSCPNCFLNLRPEWMKELTELEAWVYMYTDSSMILPATE